MGVGLTDERVIVNAQLSASLECTENKCSCDLLKNSEFCVLFMDSQVFFLAKKIFKLSLMALFTQLKIILL